MNGFIRKTVAGSCLSLSLVLLVGGCYHYRELVDPCWPERYNSMARHGVRDMVNAQADRGHMLQQTIWNWHFEREKNDAPSDRLNGAGIEVLRRITQTTPAPDFHVHLQNAQDIPYVEGVAAEKLIVQRELLNKRRTDSILRFLSTQVTASGSGNYQVAVHDIAPPGIPGAWPVSVIAGVIETNYKAGTPQAFSQGAAAK